MPPLSETSLMIHSSRHHHQDTSLTSKSNNNNNNRRSPATILRNSFSRSRSSSTEFANPPSASGRSPPPTTMITSSMISSSSSSTSSSSSSEEKEKEESSCRRKQVSFHPQIMIIEETPTPRDGKKSAFSLFRNNPYDTWYTERDIESFQRDAYFTIRRFQRQWKILDSNFSSNDNDYCLRGLEGQTYKCSATKVRICVYKELVLAKTDQTKRMIAKNPSRAREMMCVILKASKEDAAALAHKDFREAQRYQRPTAPEEDDDDDQEGGGIGGGAFKCFFWELPKWWFRRFDHHHSRSPAIVDLPI